MRTAMLFCPPLLPLRIASDSPVAIGRHPSCEFAIRKGDVSRRHAEVRAEAGRYWLRDLGSTNGTFVNGHRVDGEQQLEPGDRIEIGSSTITFCEIDSARSDAMAFPGDEKTRVAERVEAREAFHGSLAEIPPFALLQVLEMGANTGLLEIRGFASEGSIWFVAGQPVDARTEKLIGFDAAVAVVTTVKGEFRFDPRPHEGETTIRANVTDLLLEASRRLDEGEAAGL
jgi:pSer/pThr/pTyr-binding forkhead associated (FHA) protein